MSNTLIKAILATLCKMIQFCCNKVWAHFWVHLHESWTFKVARDGIIRKYPRWLPGHMTCFLTMKSFSGRPWEIFLKVWTFHPQIWHSSVIFLTLIVAILVIYISHNHPTLLQLSFDFKGPLPLKWPFFKNIQDDCLVMWHTFHQTI